VFELHTVKTCVCVVGGGEESRYSSRILISVHARKRDVSLTLRPDYCIILGIGPTMSLDNARRDGVDAFDVRKLFYS
jgi:hypothetical protein